MLFLRQSLYRKPKLIKVDGVPEPALCVDGVNVGGVLQPGQQVQQVSLHLSRAVVQPAADHNLGNSFG